MKTKFKYNYMWGTILGLSLFPIVLWLLAPSLLPRTGSWLAITSSLGQLAGLVGMALFSFSLMLSARFIILDKYFKGLNNVYAKHSLIGQVSFILLLLHPLFLVFKYAGGSLIGAVLFFSLSADWAKNWGALALSLMILLIILTLYLRPRYHIWKITHKFFGLAFFMASLHVLMIPSDISHYAPLRVYMLMLAALGLMAFTYRTLFGKFLVNKYNYIVESVTALNNNVWEISLKPLNQKLPFKAGQFIFVSFIDPSISKESHPFSISSSPSDTNLTITVKALGDYTNKLINLRPGATALLEGPFGSFSHQNSRYKNQVWIAGGIGITPFLSMAKSLKLNNDYAIDLFYCVKNNNEPIHLDLFKSLNPQIKLHLFCFDESGYVNAEAISSLSGTLTEKDIFICAPLSMVASLRQQILAQGVARKLIHSEEFNF